MIVEKWIPAKAQDSTYPWRHVQGAQRMIDHEEAARKAARTRKRRQAAREAARTRKRKSAARKAWATRRKRTAAAKKAWRTRRLPGRSNNAILDELWKQIDTILSRLKVSQLSRYHSLQCSLQKVDVSKDEGYQSLFKDFYMRQRKRKPGWYDCFFSLLEAHKKKTTVTFKEILEKIYKDQQQVEASFSSKLVATIQPTRAVYDRYVRQNLQLKTPGAHKEDDVRLAEFVRLYSGLSKKLKALTQHAKFAKFRRAFDKKFGLFADLTDMKKLDLLLWQHNRVKKARARRRRQRQNLTSSHRVKPSQNSSRIISTFESK